MAQLAILMSPAADGVLGELVEAIGTELTAQGVVTSVGATWPKPAFDEVRCVVVPAPDTMQLPAAVHMRRTIALVTDVPDGGLAEAQLELVRAAGAVFVLEPRAAAALGQLGIDSRLLRPGWSAALDHADLGSDRPIDVVVLDAERPRTAAWLNDARERLPTRRWAAADPGLGIAACAQARIAVALNAGDEATLGWRAPLQATLGGAVLVAEPARDLSVLVPGEHMLVAAHDALTWIVDAALRDGDGLDRIRNAAHRRVRGWLPLAPAVSRLRAAVIELLGEPA